jgi:hypothetical protein
MNAICCRNLRKTLAAKRERSWVLQLSRCGLRYLPAHLHQKWDVRLVRDLHAAKAFRLCCDSALDRAEA